MNSRLRRAVPALYIPSCIASQQLRARVAALHMFAFNELSFSIFISVKNNMFIIHVGNRIGRCWLSVIHRKSREGRWEIE